MRRILPQLAAASSMWARSESGMQLRFAASSEGTGVLIWKFLHVAAMFLAVAVFVGQGMLSARIVGTGDVHTIRRLITVEARFQPIGGGLLLLGLIFGFITATSAGFALTAPWLLVSYRPGPDPPRNRSNLPRTA